MTERLDPQGDGRADRGDCGGLCWTFSGRMTRCALARQSCIAGSARLASSGVPAKTNVKLIFNTWGMGAERNPLI
jgi:hypothetical protein